MTIDAMGQVGANVESALDKVDAQATSIRGIPVELSYEIITLFSEGLYQSPQKAIEELVSNGYDAGALSVHVLLPSEGSGQLLWVIDDGTGMTDDGFTQLWRVANSQKATIDPASVKRAPIGQFGIGKLAAYVLAWRLTHISCVNGSIRMTIMDFRKLQGRHQYESNEPFDLELKELTEAQARELLADVEQRDANAWDMMFGEQRANTWTAAALSDFKDLYSKLSIGRLSWVLSTGLPLHSEFKVWLNGNQLSSSKESLKQLATYTIGAADDVAADRIGLVRGHVGVIIPGLGGEITGSATIYEKKLTEGKSDAYERSNGFFIKVRERVINLADPLFGLRALNHAAWSRFRMDIQADALRDLLLSSREGVRETEEIRVFRNYLVAMFNLCRRQYDDWVEKQNAGIDVNSLLDQPSAFISEPFVEGVRRTLNDDDESYYVARPNVAVENRSDWLRDFEEKVSEEPFKEVLYEKAGLHGRVVRYMPESRTLVINTEHPFNEKLLETGKTKAAATLFGSAELMVDLLMQEHGFSRAAIIDLLADRDRVLRLVAGDQPNTAAEVLRLLESAKSSDLALEKAVGLAFRVLGFEYERRGGYQGGADGVLYARLGRGEASLADYKLVYDTKQTNSGSVAAGKIDVSSLRDFIEQEGAEFGFFIAIQYEGEDSSESKVNRKVRQEVEVGRPVTLLRIGDLRMLIELHYSYGLTLTQVRQLFESSHTVPEVEAWINDLRDQLSRLERQVPLYALLNGIEEAKSDENAKPNISAVRVLTPDLKPFPPEKLRAALKAIQTIIGDRWIEVDSLDNVTLHNTADQIVAEVERNLRDVLGINAMRRPPVK